MHILLVEDSRSSAALMTVYLEQLGHKVTHATDGRVAVELYKTQRPDLILMDVIIPEMDGIEATRQIKSLAGDHWVPLIIMTSMASSDDLRDVADIKIPL